MTFLDLQNAVLSRTGDESDQDKMRSLVKTALNTVHRQVLTERRYQFMLWPRPETLSVVSGQKYYSLHPQYAQLWYGQNTATGDFLEEVPLGELINVQENLLTGESDNPFRFVLSSVQNVKAQPAANGVMVVTTTGGTEASGNKILVKGIDENGEYAEETLSSGSNWTTLTGTTVWNTIEAITKLGATWTRTITCTVGSTVVLTLLSGEFSRQYRQLELLKSPTTNVTFNYRFFRKPLKLVEDNDMPQIPTEYCDILVYGALVDLEGYARPEGNERKEWIAKRDGLINQMQQQYQQSRSLNGRGSYINYIPR